MSRVSSTFAHRSGYSSPGSSRHSFWASVVQRAPSGGVVPGFVPPSSPEHATVESAKTETTQVARNMEVSLTWLSGCDRRNPARSGGAHRRARAAGDPLDRTLECDLLRDAAPWHPRTSRRHSRSWVASLRWL